MICNCGSMLTDVERDEWWPNRDIREAAFFYLFYHGEPLPDETYVWGICQRCHEYLVSIGELPDKGNWNQISKDEATIIEIMGR